VVERSDTTGYNAQQPSIREGCQPRSDSAMTSTFLALHFHLVFSTKNRAPVIDASWRDPLHEYLGGTVSGLGGIPQGVGGVADHVH